MSDKKRQIGFRFAIVMFFFICGAFIIIGKIVYIQYFEGPKWRKLGDEMMNLPDVLYEANRGNIYSSDGKLLASSMKTYILKMDFRADGFKRDTFFYYIDDLSLLLSNILKDASPEAYEKRLKEGYQKGSRNFRISSKPISYLQLQKLKKESHYVRLGQNKSGLFYESRLDRVKPLGSLASRTIGGIYKVEKKGSYGIESSFEKYLKGIDGLYKLKIYRGTRHYERETLLEPVDGYDVVMTIDANIQDIVEKELRRYIGQDAIRAKRACVIVMETKTGKVKAISNLVRNSDGTYSENINMAVADEVEPGSTFKTLSMMIALETGKVDTNTVVHTGNGVADFYGRNMRDWDWDYPIHRNKPRVIPEAATMAEGMYQSSNIVVATIINDLFKDNPSKFCDAIKKMGFLDSVSLDIPGSGSPYIRTPKEKGWSKTSLPWLSIGYESKVPPIYMLQFYNAIANDGKMIKPYFVEKVMNHGEVIETFDTEVINSSICSNSTLKKVQAMLEGVVSKGTGKPTDTENFQIAGKTGTAQVGGNSASGKHRYSFCGYFPADNPQYTCMVYIAEPAIPVKAPLVFKNIAEKVYAISYSRPVERTNLEISKMPISKNGNYGDIRTVANELDIPLLGKVESAWVSTAAQDNGVMLHDKSFREGLVPNVVGMGAKDAMYILGNMGLKVNIRGRGMVSQQSLSSGSYFKKGDVITLTLK